MLLKLTSADVEVAVKEYMVRRGLPADAEVEIFLRGGRKGNSGTIEVTIHPIVRQEINEATVQSFENLAEVVHVSTAAAEEEYLSDKEQIAKDMAIFEDVQKPSLSVIENAPSDTADPADMAIFDEPESEEAEQEVELVEPAKGVFDMEPAEVEAAKPKKTVGSLFNS